MESTKPNNLKPTNKSIWVQKAQFVAAIIVNVVKTGPDQPVQPGTGHGSGPALPIKPARHKTG